MAVVHHDDLDGQPVAGDGGQLRDGHLEPAVAHDGENQLVGTRELRADSRRDSEPHGAETAGTEPETRLVEPDKLRRPHLVLPHVGSDDGLAAGEPVDLGHQVLRLDLGIGRRRLERMLLFPLPYAMPPGPPGGAERFVGSALALRQQLVQLDEDAFDIAHDGHVGRAVLADFRGVDIHVDDLGVRRKCRQAPRDAVVEPHAQGD